MFRTIYFFEILVSESVVWYHWLHHSRPKQQLVSGFIEQPKASSLLRATFRINYTLLILKQGQLLFFVLVNIQQN